MFSLSHTLLNISVNYLAMLDLNAFGYFRSAMFIFWHKTILAGEVGDFEISQLLEVRDTSRTTVSFQ